MTHSERSIFEQVTIESNDQSQDINLIAGVMGLEYFENIFSPNITAKMLILNTGDSIKSICKLSLDDLVLDYVKSSTHNNLISERDFSELYTEINSSLMILEELIDDDFPDSGFTDDFSTTH